jgi:CheY-like chemotaxis protein
MKTILIIDDDKIFIKIFSDLAKREYSDRYTIISATDGQVGLQHASSSRPDIIVLDLMMPGMDGIEFLREMRSRGAHIPVLVSTHLADIDKISEGIELGIKGYVVKSDYSLESIFEEIGRILEETNPQGSESP